MPLLKLPRELLLQVLDSLGPEFFHEDIRRLAVSKTWYDLAWLVMVKHLPIDSTSRLEKFAKDADFFTRIQPYIESIWLQPAIYSSYRPGDILPLGALRNRIQRCPRLQSLKIDAWFEDQRNLGRFITSALLGKLLPITNQLTVLHIEAPTARARMSGVPHLCGLIGTLLPSLQVLHYRMATICETLLEPPPTGGGPLPLKELTVNLTNTDSKAETPILRGLSSRCVPVLHDNFLILDADIKRKVVELSRKLSNPRVVRVISTDYPSTRLVVFDALAVEVP